ncbi:GntR family transcriptional regulator [Thalassospira sp.]|uniref:GntR family transcriptional regulator n=1 Tax=Thalassospira sp. TaxID=1912094 RepID=UPI002733C273|nr:GntR family transcriptional regulator [Thalassospira sp.]MDP2699854.1 GntR family transcriptional regulator [Thalassospira sp.]
MTSIQASDYMADHPATKGNDFSGTGKNLNELAYYKLEELIVTCALKPGSYLRIQDLQTLTGINRTPVHQAVTRLSSDTLMIIQPRQGIQISPIDLARTHLLLWLRRDMERFVVSLASERASSTYRSQMRHLTGLLTAHRAEMSIVEFNEFDRRIDQLMLAACGEPFLEYTLRPLHTIFRRLGWIYHTQTAHGASLDVTIDSHLDVLNAVVAGKKEDALAASDRLIEFVDAMFPVLENDIAPNIFDVTQDFDPF